ncbi:unnamed protein product [Mortierella alpina]
MVAMRLLLPPDASSALWKAYSRVRMTLAETHTPSPLDTMTEYWHALSAYTLQEQEQIHKGEEEEQASPASSTILKSAIHGALHEPSFFVPPSAFSTETVIQGSLHRPSVNRVSPTSAMFANGSSPSRGSISIAGSGPAPQASTLCNKNTAPLATAAVPYTLVTSFQSVRSSATEQGRLLAQRSKTTLNRFLDSVLDNASPLAESNVAHESYLEEGGHTGAVSRVKDYPGNLKSNRPELQRQPAAKSMFFVCEESEDDGDEESEDEALAHMTIRRAPPARGKTTSLIDQAVVHDIQDEDFDARDYSAKGSCEETEDLFNGHTCNAMPSSQSPRSGAPSHPYRASPPASLESRQSLLSDLLQAERKQRGQDDLARRSIPPVLEGEPRIYPALRQQDQSLQYPECNRPSHTTQQHEMTSKAQSPLVRTRKVYSNLNGLARVATATATATTPAEAAASFSTTPLTSASPVSLPVFSAPARTETNSTAPVRGKTISKAAAVAGWSRSHVQVQIQSLVVQSTSTAQRALLNASSTLTDVLFRAAK